MINLGNNLHDDYQLCIKMYDAVKKGDYSQIRTLTNGDYNYVFARMEYETVTPLMCALLAAKYDVVEYMLDRGARVDLPRYIPVLQATLEADFPYALLKRMIDMGADVNAVNHLGFSPLFNVAYDNDIEKMKLLIENGAEVNHLTTYKVTPIMNLIGSPKFKLEALDYLIEQGAITNNIDRDGESVVDRAEGNLIIYNNVLLMDLIRKLSLKNYSYSEYKELPERKKLSKSDEENFTSIVDYFDSWWNSSRMPDLYNFLIRTSIGKEIGYINFFELEEMDKTVLEEIIDLVYYMDNFDAMKKLVELFYHYTALTPAVSYLMALVLIDEEEYERAKKVLYVFVTAMRIMVFDKTFVTSKAMNYLKLEEITNEQYEYAKKMLVLLNDKDVDYDDVRDLMQDMLTSLISQEVI